MLPEIEAALGQKGESLPRPDYSRTTGESSEKSDIDRGGDDDHGSPQETKNNIEATSEEE